MLLSTGFLSGPYGWELVVMALGPPVLAVLLVLATVWALLTRRGPARWAAAAGLLLSIVWTLFTMLAQASRIEGLGLLGVAVVALLAGVPLGSATTYAVSRLLLRVPRPLAREVIDASAIALLPALVAWTTFVILGVLPTDPSRILVVDPVLAAFGGLWLAAAAWLTWSRLSLFRGGAPGAPPIRRS